MDCKIIASTLQINSTTEDGTTATLDENSATCDTTDPIDLTSFIGGVATQWTFKANLVNVSNGVHALTLKNITTKDASTSTGVRYALGKPFFFYEAFADSNLHRLLITSSSVLGNLIIQWCFLNGPTTHVICCSSTATNLYTCPTRLPEQISSVTL